MSPFTPLATNVKPILSGAIILVLAACVANRWREAGQPGDAKRFHWLAGGLLVLVGILLVALGLQHQGLLDYSVELDFSSHLLRARSLAEVFVANPRTPFGYPLALWFITLFSGDVFTSAKILTGLSALAVLGLSYLLGLRLFDAYTALLTMLVLLVTPVFAEHMMLAATDMPAMAFLLASIYVLIASRGQSWWLIALAGILGAISYLMRAPALALVPAVLIWLVTLRWAKTESPWMGQRTRKALVYSLAFGLAILPHIILDVVHTGKPFYNNRAMDIWLDMYGDWDWTLAPEVWDITLIDVIRIDPWYFVVHTAQNLLETFRTIPLHWPIALFAIPGLLALPFRNRRVELGLLYWFGAGFLILVSPGWTVVTQSRVFLPLIPFLALIATWLFCYLNPLDLHLGRLRLPWREPLFLAGILIMLWSQTYYMRFLEPGTERQHSFDEPAIPNPLQANLEKKTRLLGYSIEPREVKPGEAVNLTLYWQAGFIGDTAYTVFTHVIDQDSRMWAGRDNWPQNGEFPTNRWMAGEFITDPYELTLPPDIPPGEYRIEVGMYLLETMERLNVIADDGTPQGTSVVFPGFRVQEP